jgi:PAS domain S-box-containing protein
MTRVLIVDDKEDNFYYLQALLSGHGFDVETARHGAEALVLARKRSPDVVISDLLMPVMDGYTLLRHWKADAELRNVPFVVYTATYTEAADEQLAYNLGADAFILKPAEPEEFLRRLEQVCGQMSEGPSVPRVPSDDREETLKTYSQTLIRKLEEKSLQLEETNRALEEDIARRRSVEIALRESEEVFRTLTEVMPQIIWVTRPDGHHIRFNQRWLDYTGLTLEASLGDGWLTPFHPDDQARAAALWRQSTDTGALYENEHRLRRADGAYRWMLGRALPLRDAGGTITKWFGTCTDIDDLKHADDRMREQAALLDKAQDAILVRDLDQRIRYWNKSAERLYGWSAEEAIGRTVMELFYPDTTQCDVAHAAVLETGEWFGEIEQVTKSGARVLVEGRWTLVRDDAGAPRSILTIDTDITNRRQLEEQFIRAQRMESIGTLAGGIAHDLNNVLAPILMSIDLLRQTVTDRESLETLDLIGQSAQRGADMVRQVLSFARGMDGRRTPLKVGNTIRDLVRFAGETFPKDIRIESRVGADLWTIDADPTQVHQVLLNLCVNARDAMPGGGRITIIADNAMIDEHYAAMNLEATVGPHVRIDVEDSGTGIAKDIIDRIFDPFFTTKEVGKGTGLGLATSLAIVKSHGGFIRVYSEPGEGTRFRIYLPARLRSAARDELISQAQLPRGHGETILVIDDEASIRQITKQTLEAFGYHVLLAADGSEGVAAYAAHMQEIRVVITDMMMPVMDGPATIQVLQRLDPMVRIIGASGIATAGRIAQSAKAGVREFLPKPYTAEALLVAVQRALKD